MKWHIHGKQNTEAIIQFRNSELPNYKCSLVKTDYDLTLIDILSPTALQIGPKENFEWHLPLVCIKTTSKFGNSLFHGYIVWSLIYITVVACSKTCRFQKNERSCFVYVNYMTNVLLLKRIAGGVALVPSSLTLSFLSLCKTVKTSMPSISIHCCESGQLPPCFIWKWIQRSQVPLNPKLVINSTIWNNWH